MTCISENKSNFLFNIAVFLDVFIISRLSGVFRFSVFLLCSSVEAPLIGESAGTFNNGATKTRVTAVCQSIVNVFFTANIIVMVILRGKVRSLYSRIV